MNTLTNGITLGKAKVIVDIVRKGNYEIRPAHPMNPTEICIHNTGNSGRGANAKAHNTYIHNMAGKTPAQTGYASWHFSVDDKFIYQHIPLNETAWHTGDGSGARSGNMNAIGIEICENVDMADYPQAEENAIALAVYLMKARKIALAKVKPHQAYSGKYCPRVILKRDGSFTKFHNRIEVAYKGKPVTVAQPKPVAKPATAKSHTIEKGDTFTSIAKKHGITVAELKKFNPRVKATAMKIGDVIYLYQAPVQEAPKPVAPKPAPPKPQPKPVESYPADLPLSVGSKGDTVKTIQRFLGITADGIFGNGTKAKVVAYQKMRGITADGIVGKGTWGEMFLGK